MLDKKIKILFSLFFFFFTLSCFAKFPMDPIDVRLKDMQKEKNSPYTIGLYKPTYVLPLYYTYSPDYAVYNNETPHDQIINKAELKFQISVYFPLWHHIMHKPVSLYLAYTQLSYWQAYNHSAFFRETNYEPEVFLSMTVNRMLLPGWTLQVFNLGLVHQSNGKGGNLERSWNRIYGDFVLSRGNFAVSFKPWYIFHDSSYEKYNDNMSNYLGHGKLLLIYKLHKFVFSLMSRNNIESAFQRGAVQFTASYPIYKQLRLYIQFFSGYGQSLIEYNHRTNAAGIGFALNDWV